MRIIAGSAKGRRLATPKSDKIRPALDQVKEAIFNILFDVSDMDVLDIFAGTGNVGIEALSRGATHCTFIDKSPEAIGLIRENLERCHLTEQGTVFPRSANIAIPILARDGKTFDLIFIDPPYLKNLVNPTLQLVAKHKLLRAGGTIVIERHPKEPVTAPEGLVVSDERKYGQTMISFLALN